MQQLYSLWMFCGPPLHGTFKIQYKFPHNKVLPPLRYIFTGLTITLNCLKSSPEIILKY